MAETKGGGKYINVVYDNAEDQEILIEAYGVMLNGDIWMPIDDEQGEVLAECSDELQDCLTKVINETPDCAMVCFCFEEYCPYLTRP